MSKKISLTPKQRAFVLNYVESGVVGQSAIDAGYSPTSAPSTGSELLRQPKIQKALQELRKEMEENKIAGAQEVLEMFTATMRGEARGAALRGVGEGAQVVEDIPPTVGEKLEAAKQLAKRYGLNITTNETNGEVAVRIVDDVADQALADEEEVQEAISETQKLLNEIASEEDE